MRVGLRTKVAITVFGIAALLVLSGVTAEAQPTPRPRMTVKIDAPVNGATVASPIEFIGTVTGGTPPYTFDWRIPRGTPPRLTTTTTLTQSSFTATHAPGRVVVSLSVRDASRRRAVARVTVIVRAVPPAAAKSINSTSQNRDAIPVSSVAEGTNITNGTFQVLAVNDLGMHCGDLDHRIASILPPFNVVQGQLVQRGTAQALPRLLTNLNGDLFYSASSNPLDPALARPASAPIFKTNFWDPNSFILPPGSPNPLAFDGYNPFYPPNVLANFPLTPDMGLPVPDVERLYLGDGVLAADQQAMPGVNNPYVNNERQRFNRFNVDFPFFINFGFGYTLAGLNRFTAEGIPIAPVDDQGRRNSYPLLRVDAQVGPNVVAAVQTVAPVSAEADCFRCHTSAVDGGTGAAACDTNFDARCGNQTPPFAGSPRSATAFNVAIASRDDPQFFQVPAAVSREWAADVNIIRLHDAKHGTDLEAAPPVVCQRCHYTPALDLAQVGPLGPPDANANGREQLDHRTNSRVLHTFHGQFTDLFPNDMPPPDSPLRFNNATGKPVINAFVLGKLNESCYQCHPGRDTKCLRGAMFNGGLVCQDCHGNMTQVGDDFSRDFPTTPFPDGVVAGKRIPWANEPGCQSCHTGDARNNLTGTAGAIVASDRIRLLQAYLRGDAAATPIESPEAVTPTHPFANRFAENTIATPNGDRRALYRVSKGHSGILCEACHGSTHAEWPVLPSTGTTIANDNLTPIQLQGHAGKLTECTVCHAVNSIPPGLDGPHGIHSIDQRWVSGHEGFVDAGGIAVRNECRACHGLQGQGTVLSAAAANRTFTVEGRTVSLAQGRQISCGICHENPL